MAPEQDAQGLPERIVSGGQTGVDRAALDYALARGLPSGGWCPKGRRAEDGPIPNKYPLVQTPAESYEERTAWNVRDSDGTLILTRGAPSGGTALTVECAENQRKPYLVIDLDVVADTEASGDEHAIGFLRASLHDWLSRHQVRVLNIAGPRESGIAGIYEAARRFLEAAL